MLSGLQQLWVGKHYAGRTVTLWIDLASIHVLLDDTVLKTVASRLTTTDLERLTLRGVRPARPSPAAAAVDTATVVKGATAIEVDRTVGRDGIVTVRGHQLQLEVDTAGTRVTLRIDGGPIHATAGNMLLKTLPNPLDTNEIRRLTDVRKASTPLPPRLQPAHKAFSVVSRRMAL